jgi:Spy/CpxP family protein refolding chaperone
MSRGTACLVSVGMVVALSAAAVLAQNRTRSWWQDEEVTAALKMTAQQSADVEAIFRTTLPRLRDLKDELDELEAELSAMINDRRDEAVVAAKLDEVEYARGALNKARTLMLYRMHRVLTPEQEQQLEELFDKRERERRGSSNAERSY